MLLSEDFQTLVSQVEKSGRITRITQIIFNGVTIFYQCTLDVERSIAYRQMVRQTMIGKETVKSTSYHIVNFQWRHPCEDHSGHLTAIHEKTPQTTAQFTMNLYSLLMALVSLSPRTTVIYPPWSDVNRACAAKRVLSRRGDSSVKSRLFSSKAWNLFDNVQTWRKLPKSN